MWQPVVSVAICAIFLLLVGCESTIKPAQYDHLCCAIWPHVQYGHSCRIGHAHCYCHRWIIGACILTFAGASSLNSGLVLVVSPATSPATGYSGGYHRHHRHSSTGSASMFTGFLLIGNTKNQKILAPFIQKGASLLNKKRHKSAHAMSTKGERTGSGSCPHSCNCDFLTLEDGSYGVCITKSGCSNKETNTARKCTEACVSVEAFCLQLTGLRKKM